MTRPDYEDSVVEPTGDSSGGDQGSNIGWSQNGLQPGRVELR